MIVNGKQIANRLKEEIKSTASSGAPKKIGIFYAGINPVIESFISRKQKFGADVGVMVEVVRFPEEVSKEELISSIISSGEKFDGVIVQLPLPAHLDKQKILDAVPITKDIDVLSTESVEAMFNRRVMRLSPVVGAIDEIFREYKVDLRGKDILIIGMGALVGKPVSLWLQREGFVPQMADKDTVNMTELISSADVIISGAGVPGLLKKDMIKPGVVLIDAGASTDGGLVRGDIDPGCAEVASLYSGVPGGVGPITVAKIFQNLFL